MVSRKRRAFERLKRKRKIIASYSHGIRGRDTRASHSNGANTRISSHCRVPRARPLVGDLGPWIDGGEMVLGERMVRGWYSRRE